MRVDVPRRAAALLAVLATVSASAWRPGAPDGRQRALLESWASQPSMQRAPDARRIRLVLAPEGNEARYRVNEQLARVDLPSDAVGVTSAITGALVLEEDGTVVSEESRFVVDLTTLRSDNSRRDNYLRRNTLQTAQHPNAEFVPTALRGLPGGLPSSGEVKLEVVGDLTIHGVTKAVTWAVSASASNGGYRGTATTSFNFADFDIPIPRVAMVLSVKDAIRLEYDFHLVPDARGPLTAGGSLQFPVSGYSDTRT